MKTREAQLDEPKTLKVRAVREGYFGEGPIGSIFRNKGDVFTLTSREVPLLNAQGKAELDDNGRLKTRTVSIGDQFSANWMEPVSDQAEPDRITTAQDEINRQVAALNSNGA